MHRDEIGSDVHYGTKEILDRYGIPYEHRAARLATTADYDKFDYIVGMDRYNMRDMMSLYHNDPDGKLSLLMDWVGETLQIRGIPAISTLPTKMSTLDVWPSSNTSSESWITDYGQRIPKTLGTYPTGPCCRTFWRS